MRLAKASMVIPALVVCLVGCAGAAGQSTPEPEPEPRALTKHERNVIDEAEGVLTQRCMERRGYRIFLTEPPEPAADLPYGNDDVEFAHQHGLGLGETLTTEERKSTLNGRYFTSLSEDQKNGYLEALNGSTDHEVSVRLSSGQTVAASTESCTAEAQRELYGDFADWFRTSSRVGNLPQRYMPKVAKDPRYRRAEKAWATCMRNRDHKVARPAELRAKWTRSPDRRAERAAAVDEARCGRKSDLPDIGQQVERKYRERTHDAHRRLIRHYQVLSVAALQRARDVTTQTRR